MATSPCKVTVAKSTPAKVITVDFDAIDRALAVNKDPVVTDPPTLSGWLTAVELGRLKGWGRAKTAWFIRNCVNAGIMELGKKRIPRMGHTPVMATAYRFNKEYLK